MAAKLDHEWYEQAADVITNESSTTAERLAVLNELWGEYSFMANRKICGFSVIYEPPKRTITDIVNDELVKYTGFTLDEIIRFAKEKIENGTNETQEAASNSEQLG